MEHPRQINDQLHLANNMKQHLIRSSLLHLGMMIIMSLANLSFFFSPPTPNLDAMKIEFLEKPPKSKTLAPKPIAKPTDKPPKKEQDKDASPPPKPAPGIKTKASEATTTQKATDTKNAAVNKPSGQTIPKKNAPPAPAQKKPATKAQEKTAQPANKTSQGIVKKQQEVESVDAVLNTLLPNVGGETNNDQKKTQASNSFEMPDILEHKAVEEIRSQIEAVWNYNPTEGINFYLTIKIDPSGKILSLKLSGTDRQTALQKAAAEAAYRATLRLSKFKLPPAIFKPEHYKTGWSEIEVHFRPRS